MTKPPKKPEHTTKHYNLNSNENIFLCQGSAISSGGTYANNCEFTYIDFSKV
ncbi:MAG: hypothetical protein IKP65_04420 [Alphaproteobacteria bacterium]|nr:hypothetical protein [Alphaproteobacteria bacterium]